MARTFVDSNVFFYAKVGDRVFGESCKRVLKAISLGRLQASISVLIPLEVANALRRYGLTKDVRSEVAAMLSMGMDVLPLEASDLGEIGTLFEETGVSPYDCSHSVLMRRYSIREMISADADFDRFAWLVRKDPRRIPVD